MQVFRKREAGSVAPLAVLFTMLSMGFTIAYLRNSSTVASMERYRYAEAKAQYLAEAGLNEVGIVMLPGITSADTTMFEDGRDFGIDERGDVLGQYRNIHMWTDLIENSTRKYYSATSEGVVKYTTPSGNEVDVVQRVSTIMKPEGFEEFMYFTNEELPTGPPNEEMNGGVINFGGDDKLEGRVHTNGTINFSNFGCPEIDPNAEVTITYEAVDGGGGIGSMGACSDDVFEFEDASGESYTILDTVSQIIWPPSTSAENAKSNANNTIIADSKITFSPSKQDTMIMSEIHFADEGYYLTQWWYLIPPIGGPPNEFSYLWDETSATNFNIDAGHLRIGFDNTYTPGVGYTFPAWLIINPQTSEGENVYSILNGIESGSQIQIQNISGSKTMIIEVGNHLNPSGNVAYNVANFSYTSIDDIGFLQNEAVTFINLSADTDLDPTIEFNAYANFHSHTSTDYCRVDGLQHFDLEYWRVSDIFSNPDAVYNSDYVVFPKTFFPYPNKPQVLYVRGGQVLIRGTIKGKYTIVTDDYIEYRRHDNQSIVDRVWGNIWLIDDIVYEDSNPLTGEVIHPEAGGTENILGLIAGGNVIIANTRPNGARAQQYGQDIKINSAMMAMHGGFLSHYWQNTLSNYGNPNTSNPYNSLADGQGRYRNPYYVEASSPGNTGQNDIRGTVYVWGAIVQSKRGYMKRNTVGPYNASPGVGYDKDYHYDYNLKDNPPPHYPNPEDVDGNVILHMSSYGIAQKE